MTPFFPQRKPRSNGQRNPVDPASLYAPNGIGRRAAKVCACPGAVAGGDVVAVGRWIHDGCEVHADAEGVRRVPETAFTGEIRFEPEPEPAPRPTRQPPKAPASRPNGWVPGRRGPGRGRRITHGGRTLNAAEWARQPEQIALGITESLIRNRMRLGWSAERALTEPNRGNVGRPRDRRAPSPTPLYRGELTYQGRSLTLRQWAKRPEVQALGISVAALYYRAGMGWSPERILTTPKSSQGGNALVTKGRSS